MRKVLMSLLLVLFSCSLVIGAVSKEKGIEFYTFNYAFSNQQITVISGHDIFTGKFIPLKKREWIGDMYHTEITMPTTGREAYVIIRFRAYGQEETRVAVFKLGPYSYVGHTFYVGVGNNIFLASNFGPIKEMLRGTSYWRYPEDCLRSNSNDIQKLKVGDLVWTNGGDIGDKVYSWLDKNNHVKPCYFGDGEHGKLRPAIVTEILNEQHENHPRVKIKTWYPNFKSTKEYYSYMVIPEQRIVLINW